jgi:hypothetical protein
MDFFSAAYLSIQPNSFRMLTSMAGSDFSTLWSR